MRHFLTTQKNFDGEVRQKSSESATKTGMQHMKRYDLRSPRHNPKHMHESRDFMNSSAVKNHMDGANGTGHFSWGENDPAVPSWHIYSRWQGGVPVNGAHECHSRKGCWGQRGCVLYPPTGPPAYSCCVRHRRVDENLPDWRCPGDRRHGLWDRKLLEQ
jgi:hypothetical protein